MHSSLLSIESGVMKPWKN